MEVGSISGSFIMPGLDYRYHWSNVPAYLVIVANAIVFSG